VLRPGGILLATVPAYSFLWSEHDEALGHRRRYRRRELRARLAEEGFAIEACAYVMGSILPVAAAVRLLQRRRRPDAPPRSDYIVLPRALNDLLAHLTGLGGHLVNRVPLPFGLSVLAVARKPGA
jgi:hypothetical protein